MLLYVHLCNVDKIKYKTIEKDFYERFSYCIYHFHQRLSLVQFQE